MATKDKRSTAEAVLPTNEAIWSGRKLSVPKATKVKPTREQQTRKGAKRK